jgi:hypothetical protein
MFSRSGGLDLNSKNLEGNKKAEAGHLKKNTYISGSTFTLSAFYRYRLEIIFAQTTIAMHGGYELSSAFSSAS